MENTLDTNIFTYTQKKLTAYFQNNQDFNFDFVSAYEYYKLKLLPFVKEEHYQKVEEMLFEGIKGQIFNGYYIAMEILSNNEATINDEWFTQSDGRIAQELPDMLRIATDDNIEEIITNEPLGNLIKWLVVEYEGVYPLLMDISLNSACIGAKWAFKDESTNRGIAQYEPQYKGILSNLDDSTFINPQTYLELVVTNGSGEVWDMINSHYRRLEKVGEITLLKIPNGTEKDNVFVNVTIQQDFSEEIQQALLESITMRIAVMNEIERDNIFITVTTAKEFFQYS